MKCGHVAVVLMILDHVELRGRFVWAVLRT